MRIPNPQDQDSVTPLSVSPPGAVAFHLPILCHLDFSFSKYTFYTFILCHLDIFFSKQTFLYFYIVSPGYLFFQIFSIFPYCRHLEFSFSKYTFYHHQSVNYHLEFSFFKYSFFHRQSVCHYEPLLYCRHPQFPSLIMNRFHILIT